MQNDVEQPTFFQDLSSFGQFQNVIEIAKLVMKCLD